MTASHAAPHTAPHGVPAESHAAGIVLSLAVHGLLVAAVVAAHASGAGERAGRRAGAAMNVITARLVRLGTPPAKAAMPHRHVPLLSTAPPDRIALSKNADAAATAPRPERPPGAVEDTKLRRVLERARAFAEIGDAPPEEGSPFGVPDGDVTNPSLARAGDVYFTRIARMLREVWVTPTMISTSELTRLVCEVTLPLGEGRAIGDARVARSSGNRFFDASVLEALAAFRQAHRVLPEPPASLAPAFAAGAVTLRFRGSDLQP